MPNSAHPGSEIVINATLLAVTERIRQRSLPTRTRYLATVAHARTQDRARVHVGCANFAHAFAASGEDRAALRAGRWPSLAIISAYNDILSAHQPLSAFPEIIKQAAREVGAVAQFAGGVPAMCDGVTQGETGMELSLFSRDVIAMSTAIALSHQIFDGALCLGVCDKIVPGLLIGALQFGHLPIAFSPAGPMGSGLSNPEKAKVRERYARGEVDRAVLLEAEAQSYHSPGTCTFYGTANSNQMLMEIMGLHLPGSSFVAPFSALRTALVRATTQSLVSLMQHSADAPQARPLAKIIDEKALVNGIVGLLATGGSTNHTLHLVAIARAAGLIIDWDDFDALSAVVPLLCRIYPNGVADVNHFHAAGGMGFLIRELLTAGLLHADVATLADAAPIQDAIQNAIQATILASTGSATPPLGLWAYAYEPVLSDGHLQWRPTAQDSGDLSVLRPVHDPFDREGGLKRLQGNLGRAVVKVSSVAAEHRVIEAPALIFDSQTAVLEAFARGELNRDFVAVIRYQGPRANGMPELHKLTPALSVLQAQGHRVALLTDGRMSGASGKVLAAIHVTPEALDAGPLAHVHEGDVIRIDSLSGELNALVPAAQWAQRHAAPQPDLSANEHGCGRELFGALRAQVSDAEHGAASFGW